MCWMCLCVFVPVAETGALLCSFLRVFAAVEPSAVSSRVCLRPRRLLYCPECSMHACCPTVPVALALL